MKKKYIIVIFLLGISFFSFAQKEKEKKPKKEKPLPENIETFPKTYLIRPRFVFPQVWIDVSNRLRGKGDQFRYKPAMPGVVGLSLKIKKVYISAALQLPADETLKKKYGATKPGEPQRPSAVR